MLLEAELEASQQEREELEALEAARKMEAGAEEAEEAEEALETVLNQAGGVVEALDEVDGAMEAEAMVAEAIEAMVADSEEVTMEEDASAELAGADHDATEMMDHESRPSEARAALQVRVVAEEAPEKAEEAPTAQAAKAEEQAVPDCKPSAIEADAPPPPSSVKFRRKGPDGTQLDSTPRPTPPSRAPRALAPSPLLCGIRATVAAAAAAGAAAAPRALSFGPDGTPIDPETGAEEEAETVLRAPEAAAAEEARLEMTYRRTTVIEDLSSKDERQRRRVREHAVTNRAGVIRARLVRIDDREPSESEVASDARKEGDARKETTRRRRGPDFVDEALVRQFDFTLEGEETVEGRRTFRLSYKAKPERKGTDKNIDRFLGLVGGKIWIDAEEFELAKVSAGLNEPLRILGGFAASITRLEFDIIRRPVAPGCWCHVLLSSRAEGRRLFSGFNVRLEVEQGDFRILPMAPASP
jgi:hypothetical protein